jgi:hypothetical protein
VNGGEEKKVDGSKLVSFSPTNPLVLGYKTRDLIQDG